MVQWIWLQLEQWSSHSNTNLASNHEARMFLYNAFKHPWRLTFFKSNIRKFSMHYYKVRDHSELSSGNNKRAYEQYEAIIPSSSMRNFRSCLESFYSREDHEDMAELQLELFRNNLSNCNSIRKAFENCHYIFSGKTWSENTSTVNIHDEKKERGRKLPKFVSVSSNPSSYFSDCVLLLSPSCWNHKGKKMQGHKWR